MKDSERKGEAVQLITCYASHKLIERRSIRGRPRHEYMDERKGGRRSVVTKKLSSEGQKIPSLPITRLRRRKRSDVLFS